MKVRIFWLFLASLIVLTIPCSAQQPSAKPRPNVKIYLSTTTTLAITSEGSAATSVNSGSVVELTATVVAGSTPVTVGTVNFCDAAATYCTDIHILGSAVLTSAGTAVFKFIPGIGPHYYQAIYTGNATDAHSSSSVSQLTVKGLYPTTTAVSVTGQPGNYTLKATVTSLGGTIPPVGNVNFVDTSQSNIVVATESVTTAAPGLSWSNPQTVLTGNDPVSPVVADFNLDGIPDLAFANYADNTVTVLLGDGNGTFTPASEQITYTAPAALAVGDFQSDGKPGLVISDYGSDMVAAFNGYGDGRFYGWGTMYTGGTSANAFAVGDFDGDGNQDVAINNACGPDNCATPTSPGTVAVFPLGGEQSSGTQTNLTTGILPSSIAAADFNGDGILDLAVANTGASSNTVTIFLGNGDGTFNTFAKSPVTGTGSPKLVAADFNGDGKADLAVTNEGANKVTILIGNGDGSFTQTATSPVTGNLPSAIAVGDFNGDTVPDLAVTNSADGTVSILIGKGDGTFTTQATTIATDLEPNSLAVGDFNGDGVADLAVANYQANTLAILLSQTTPTATASVSFLVNNSASANVEARFIGDAYHASSVSSTVTLKGPIFPTVTWPTPAAITYGTALSAKQLDATASVAGKFVYTPAAGLVPTAGTQTLSVEFTPTDTVDYTHSSASVSLTVNKAPTTIKVVSSLNPVAVGQSLTFTATVTSPLTSATGTVTFKDGSTVLGTGTLNASGVATYKTSTLAGGAQSITAVYAGDSNNLTSTSTALTQTVETAATMTSPTPDSALTGPSATFTWTAKTGSAGYWLFLGTTGAGSKNLYDSGEQTATSATFSALPGNGGTIYARVYTSYNGTLVYNDYTYTAWKQPAVLTSPKPGSTLAGASATFTWTTQAGSAGYWLFLGTTGAGSKNLYDSNEQKATSATFSSLPTNGATIYARVYTSYNGVLVYNDYTYKAQ